MENKTSKNLLSSRRILFLFVSLISVMLLLAMTLTSCGSEVSDIVIKDSDKPRTTYVQGQDLDFSNGILTVIVDGSETEIPLTDPEVSISGYDKNTLGKQTVTVSYQEKSTTIEVNVVPRMTADGYKSNYFVGDTFDKTQGRLKITKDDGKTTTVNLDSELVTVKSFDTTSAGDTTVTVVYSDGTVSYEASFTVKVYAISEVVFTKPRKTVYSSHDGELSLAGGYFTVKASGTDLSTPIPLTIDMQTGFDLSAATPAHRVEPLKQTIVFTYAGQSFEFEISILYSGVSVVQDAAKALADLEITGRDMEIDPELAAIAIDAANEYFKLTTARKELISEEDVLKVMRPAAICVYRAFLDAAVKFEDTFTVDTKNGNLNIKSESYDQLKAAIVDFEKASDPFNVYAYILNSMKEEFKDVYLFSEVVDEKTVEVKIPDYVKSPSGDELSFYVDLFKYMLNVSDIMKTVPDDWTEATLSDYKEEITEAFNYMITSNYTGPRYNGVYNSISSWREKDDFFEIIYTYYIYVVGDKEAFFDSINSNQGLKLHLPGELQTWYTNLSYGANILLALMQNANTTDLRLYDMSAFMYYYNNVNEAIDVIKASDNKLYKDIYDFIGGDYLTYSLVEHPQSLGYLYHAYTMLESEAFVNVMNAYVDLAALYVEGKRINLDEETEKFNTVLTKMGELSPSELYGFISAISLLYSEADTDAYAFDYKDNTVRNILAYLMSYYDAYNFGGENRVLMQLLLAAEKGATMQMREGGYEAFTTAMSTFLTTYNGMSKDDQDKLQEIAGGLYAKYVGIYTNYATTTTPDLGASTDDYNALADSVADFYTILALVYDQEADNATKQYYYHLLFTLAEKSIRLYSKVLDGTDAAVLALSTIEYALGEDNLTIENAMIVIKSEFYYNMVFKYQNYGTQEDPRNISFWVTYSALPNFRQFMAVSADALMAYYLDEEISALDIKNIVDSFLALSDAEKAMFSTFSIITSQDGGVSSMYYDMMFDYFVASGANETMARAILQAEMGYIVYAMDKTDTNRIKYFTDCMSPAKAEYNKLSPEEQEALDQLLKDIYNYYLTEYNKLLDT